MTTSQLDLFAGRGPRSERWFVIGAACPTSIIPEPDGLTWIGPYRSRERAQLRARDGERVVCCRVDACEVTK